MFVVVQTQYYIAPWETTTSAMKRFLPEKHYEGVPDPEKPWPRVKHSSMNAVCRGELIATMRGDYVELHCSGCLKTFGVIETAAFLLLWPDYFKPR